MDITNDGGLHASDPLVLPPETPGHHPHRRLVRLGTTAVKTCMIEYHIVETMLPSTIWDGFNPLLAGSDRRNPVPYLFNQSPHRRPLALFFDGSVRIHTMQEAKQSDDRVRNGGDWYGLFTSLGGQDYYTAFSLGFGYSGTTANSESNNHHVFTRKSIKGRDCIDPAS